MKGNLAAYLFLDFSEFTRQNHSKAEQNKIGFEETPFDARIAGWPSQEVKLPSTCCLS
jgi:hypothetical protein